MGCCSRGYISLGCCSRENISLGCCFSHCEFGFDSWTYNNGKMAKSAIKGTLRLVYSKMEIWTHRMGIPSIPLSLSVHLIQLVRCHMLPDAIVTARWKKKNTAKFTPVLSGQACPSYISISILKYPDPAPAPQNISLWNKEIFGTNQCKVTVHH